MSNNLILLPNVFHKLLLI